VRRDFLRAGLESWRWIAAARMPKLSNRRCIRGVLASWGRQTGTM
jgi:hypothetical protein